MSDTKPTAHMVLDAEHFERVISQMMVQAEDHRAELSSLIAAAVANGMADGLRQALKDEETVEKFWRVGYKHLSAQAHDDVSRSIGRRVIGWLSAALLAAGITLAALNAKG